MKKKRIRFVLFILALCLVFYTAFTATEIWNYGNTDHKKQSDVAIVLGSATYNGRLSEVYKERINHGIWLINNGYCDYIILTGGVAEGNTVSDAAAAKKYALSMGVAEDKLLIEESSKITEENFTYSKRLMDENNLNTAIIVSDPLHMKRAMLIARDKGVTGVSSPTPTTRYLSLKTKLPFLARELVLYIGYSAVRIFK